jgi:folate-binding protein YgfZ
MTTNSAFWCRSPRDAVQVAGPDAGTYLQSQASQELRPLQVGASVWTFLLQPTGKVDVLARVWRTAEDEYVLDTDSGFGQVMVARINRFKIRVKADVTPLDWTCVAVRGVDRTDDQGVVAWGRGYDLLGPAPIPPADVAEGDPDALQAARIDAAWPVMGAEIVPGETIPAETGVTADAVSFTKGCYPGQELVERMDSRAAVAPKLLQRITAAEAEAMGARVTSRHGDTVLAYVPRSALPH